MSIRRKLLLTSLAGAIPLVVVGTIAVRIAGNIARDEVFHGLRVSADLERGRVNDALGFMDDRLESTGTLVADQVTRRNSLDPPAADSPTALQALLDDAVMRMGDLRALAAYLPDGTLLGTSTGTHTPKNAATPALIEEAQRGLVIGRAFRVASRDDRYVHYRPARDSTGRVSAILVAECDLTPVAHALSDLGDFGDTADAHLVQRLPNGDAEFITTPRFAPGREFGQPIPAAATTSPAQLALNNPAMLVRDATDYRQRRVLAATRPIEHSDWALIAKIDRREAYAEVNRLARVLIAAFFIGVALLALTSMFMARSIIRRVRRLTTTATAISRGDLSQRMADPSGDEIGTLSTAFDDMTDQLVEDIRRRQRVEAQLEHQARHDPLTGLPTRWAVLEQLDKAITQAKPGYQGVGVLFCDLDRFKGVNDELGHGMGDRVLHAVAHRLQAALRPDDILARFGGDEFLIVRNWVTHPSEVDRLASRLQDALTEPLWVEGSEVALTMSVGSATSFEPTTTSDALVRDADTAMYRAKDLGRNLHVAKHDGGGPLQRRQLPMIADLRRALDHGLLTVSYQPVVDLGTGGIEGFEALVRWPHPDRGLVKPGAFVGVAERHGLIQALDRWVLAQACDALARWHHDGHAHLTVAVNMSASLLSDPRIVEIVEQAIARTRIDPTNLVLEVTEVAFGDGEALPVRHLRELRDLGVSVAIDDFGTGYSSLGRLRMMPFDILKIDQSFVFDIDRDQTARSIAESITGLARTLRLKLVAEGVEREGQHEVLRTLGCDAAQGYYFSPPTPADRIPHLLESAAAARRAHSNGAGTATVPYASVPDAAEPQAGVPQAGGDANGATHSFAHDLHA